MKLVRGPLAARVRAAPSKSATHRALIAAALADGPSVVRDPLDADDTRATLSGLAGLGVRVAERPGAWVVDGAGASLPGGGMLELAESGTSVRFLLALACLGARPSQLDGAPQLRRRPLRPLADALRACGAEVATAQSGGGLPAVAGGHPPRGGAVELPGDESSQFASALLLIGSRLPEGVLVRIRPPAVSLPYVEMTVRTLEEFGVRVSRVGPLGWQVEPGGYPGRNVAIEGDHSSSSYFLAAAAVAGGRVRVDGLVPGSAQPDARLGSLLERVGCRVTRGHDWIEVEGDGRPQPFDENLADAPDLVPTLAVIALFADGASRIRGIGHLRLKESDRLAGLAENLRALGRPAEVRDDGLEIGSMTGPLHDAEIRTRSDHRMAMAFALAGLRVGGIRIDDAGCVSKSNPRFWQQWDQL